MRSLPTPADFLAERARRAPLARLFVLKHVARCVERKSMNSPEVDLLYPRYLFHGEYAGDWIKRLPSEGGGYIFRSTAREV